MHLFSVEAHRRSFGMAPGAQYRPVVIERHPGKSLVRQTFHDKTARFIPHFGNTLCVRTGERTADRGYVRQPLQTGNAFDHPVIPVGVHVAQLPMSDDQVHDQQHHDHVMTVNGIGPQVAGASPQPFPGAEEGEEMLEESPEYDVRFCGSNRMSRPSLALPRTLALLCFIRVVSVSLGALLRSTTVVPASETTFHPIIFAS